MRQLGTISLIVCLAAASGCNICCWGKRATELTGPTDIRKSHFWCLGEDAVFAQPMGPSREDYGLKPTCWREWPADGGRCIDGSQCADGSCGPTMPPGVPVNGSTPNPMWQPTQPSEKDPQINPFEDDMQKMPAPAGQGALRRSPAGAGHSYTARPASGERKPGANPAPPRNAASNILTNDFAPRQIQAPRKMAAPMSVPAPVRLQDPRQTSSIEKAPLKITISQPIDTPVQFLAPVEFSQTPVHAASATTQRATEHATLASLEQMIEVPASDTPTAMGPQVVQNDFAPQPQPFRLATRASISHEVDPALENKTLSALDSMISTDVPATNSR